MEEINLMDSNIFDFIVETMNTVQKTTGKGVGFKKKQLVLQSLKTFLGNQTFERYEPLISIIIEGLISLDKKDIKLILNKSKKCYRNCCG